MRSSWRRAKNDIRVAAAIFSFAFRLCAALKRFLKNLGAARQLGICGCEDGLDIVLRDYRHILASLTISMYAVVFIYHLSIPRNRYLSLMFSCTYENRH